MRLKVSHKPTSDLPLFSIPMSNEGRTAPPTVALTTGMRVLPNLSAKDKVQNEKGSVLVALGEWELLTVVVDCRFGRLQV